MIHTAPFRLIAVVLAVVLLATLATPTKADADPTLIIALVGVGLAVVILVVFLIVANIEGSKVSEGQSIWFACVGDECSPIPATVVDSLGPIQLTPVERQGP